jgi:hypothetical protein
MSVPARVLRPALLSLVLLLSGCGAAAAPSDAGGRGSQPAYPVAGATTVRVVAVGDIACPPGQPASGTTCRQASTAALAQRLAPDLVLTLGDHQYEQDSLAQFQGSYARSWGALLAKTRPTIGNHEYYTAGAKGYYTYFSGRQPGPPGYYRVSANGWNIYLLNSNCDRISCATEAAWLNRQMAAHPSRCSIITMHHPRYSSGAEHGNSTAVKPLWTAAYNRRNDIVLSGHDHDYERFRPMDPSSHVQPSRGMVEFVSGTGGKNLYHLGTRKVGSAYFQARIAGVLALDLKPGSYSWAYRNINGVVMDSGSRSCL